MARGAGSDDRAPRDRRRVVVVGAGVGGLACALRLARAGHDVTVLEQAATAGGKCGRLERGGFAWDTGPSLLTMPWVLRELVPDVELVRVEPVTRYRFADGSSFDLSADLPQALEALEAWSPGAGADWARFLGTCGAMWRASVPFLTGPPPWPPRRPADGAAPPDPRDLLRVKPWHTLRTLARAQIREPRLRTVVERFATYAGADPRRAPAALALAGYVEHAFGAWHARGGVFELVRGLERALHAAGGEVRFGVEVARVLRTDGRVTGVETAGGAMPAEIVVWNGDGDGDSPPESASLKATDPGRGDPGRPGPAARERSLSGFALMLGLRGREPGRVHHEIRFGADYDAEFDDVFATRRPVRDPTLYLACSAVTDPGEAPDDAENLFVLVNAPTHLRGGPDWDAHADRYEERLLERLGIDRGRILVRARRTPADLERETGAVGGSIYGDAPHGRLGTLRRPPNRVGGVRGLWRVGGTTHPGGGLPMVMLSAKIVADEIATAR